MNARYPGCVHDSAIFRTSLARLQLFNKYQRTGQNRGILLGDQSFGTEPWIFPPISGNSLTPNERSFNRAHKVVRMGVENSIGDLKNRFRCLLKDRVLHFTPTFAGKIVYACATIHNLRIRLNVLSDDEYEPESDDESQESEIDASESESEVEPIDKIEQGRIGGHFHPGKLFTVAGNRKRKRYIRNHFHNQ